MRVVLQPPQANYKTYSLADSRVLLMFIIGESEKEEGEGKKQQVNEWKKSVCRVHGLNEPCKLD